jgi:UDP-glucose 4-epimerase
MKIAITGTAGRVGRHIALTALKEGHTVVGMDRIAETDPIKDSSYTFLVVDMTDYEQVVKAFAGCDALIHMAAIPSPFRHPDHEVHNNNVVGSYNALRAAVENGIMRICQASSVNAIGLSFSRAAHFDYFPIDEKHPSHNEEPYGLSKEICEAQGDSFARRYEDIRIASMRFHLVTDARETAQKYFNHLTDEAAKHLWAYTLYDAAARACIMSLTASYKGHEVFYIVAPDTTWDIPTAELAARFFPDVPVTGDISGNKSFFSSAKAERMLGWTHSG